MNNDTYAFRAYNTLEHISFHDCKIIKTELYNNNLILYFDYLDILKTHPNNKTGKAKKTDNALLCFENVKILTSQFHDYSKACKNAFEKKKKSGDTSVTLDIETGEIEISNIYFIDALNNMYIFSLETLNNNGTYICKIEGDGYMDFQYKDLRIIEFEYSNSYVCFNNFTSDAWFESDSQGIK